MFKDGDGYGRTGRLLLPKSASTPLLYPDFMRYRFSFCICARIFLILWHFLLRESGDNQRYGELVLGEKRVYVGNVGGNEFPRCLLIPCALNVRRASRCSSDLYGTLVVTAKSLRTLGLHTYVVKYGPRQKPSYGSYVSASERAPGLTFFRPGVNLSLNTGSRNTISGAVKRCMNLPLLEHTVATLSPSLNCSIDRA